MTDAIPSRLIRPVATIAASALLVWSLINPTASANAYQSPGEVFTIVAGFPEDVPRDEILAARELQGTLTATVHGDECGTVDLLNDEDQLLVFGVEGQPESCHEVGAEIILYNAHGNEMFERFVMQPGETAFHYNYAVAPLDTRPTAPSPGATGSLGPQIGSSAAATRVVGGAMLFVGLLSLAALRRGWIGSSA